MSLHTEEVHFVAFDPGGTTGWAHFIVHADAFATPDTTILDHIEYWNCGEFQGSLHERAALACGLIQQTRSRSERTQPTPRAVYVVSESFDLTQRMGGAELLEPIQLNAIIGYFCATQGFHFTEQARQLRRSVTKERLALWGFQGPFRKDEFAAMQHALRYIRSRGAARATMWE